MNDDLDAIRRVRAGDIESFRCLVERYQGPLLTMVRNMTPPDTDHEGVVQEVFLAAFRSLESFDPKRSAFRNVSTRMRPTGGKCTDRIRGIEPFSVSAGPLAGVA